MSKHEPPPQNELERLIPKAEQDPALLGKLMRLLLASELYILIPENPALDGEHSMEEGGEFSFLVYTDAKGPFAAVYASEAAAEFAAREAPGPRPAFGIMPGEAMFKMLKNSGRGVSVNYGLSARIRMQPEAVGALADGKFTHRRAMGAPSGPSPGPGSMVLHHVPAEEVPAKLRQAIRVFCAQRRAAISVYVFNPETPRTGEVNKDDLRVIVWLRDNENDFYNDFTIMLHKLTPKYLTSDCAGVTSEDADAVAFLQEHTPLWPVV
ncbi:MAG TPA: SseB family protein [Chthoniobacteraceae bacterium]|jgi:hypothetical protein|nr:SseB family protein [Chthoniobacteraceae bacterium]